MFRCFRDVVGRQEKEHGQCKQDGTADDHTFTTGSGEIEDKDCKDRSEHTRRDQVDKIVKYFATNVNDKSDCGFNDVLFFRSVLFLYYFDDSPGATF